MVCRVLGPPYGQARVFEAAMDDDAPPEENWAKNLANLASAIRPFLPKFPNLRKVRYRLLGDVADAAFGALASRLRLYQTRNQAEAIMTIVERTGLPPSVALEMVSKQQAMDTMVADALGRIAADRPDQATVATDTSDAVTDDDWFDAYRREAADRSAGDMREAFVRVLAGEIRQPGSFSVQTLRVLGSISTATARGFRRAASLCVSMELDARVPAVGGRLGDNCLDDVGMSFDVLTALTENGLLHADYSCWKGYGPLHEANPGVVLPPNAQLPFRHQNRRWALLAATDDLKVKPVKVHGAAFTTAGREILQVADIEPMPRFTERLKAHFADGNYQMVEVPEGTGRIYPT